MSTTSRTSVDEKYVEDILYAVCMAHPDIEAAWARFEAAAVGHGLDLSAVIGHEDSPEWPEPVRNLWREREALIDSARGPIRELLRTPLGGRRTTRQELESLKAKLGRLVREHAFFLDNEEIDGPLFTDLTAGELRELYFLVDEGVAARATKDRNSGAAAAGA